MKECYDWLININSLKFENKSVLLVGAGNIAKHHITALMNMNIDDITIISNSNKNLSIFPNTSKIKFLYSGFEKNLPLVEQKDLMIIATPIPLLHNVANFAIDHNQNNILIEKPGSLYSEDLLSLEQKINSQTVKIAYNRLVYPSLHKLKKLIQEDGGISSCRFTITEWTDKINLSNNIISVYQKWGISNSLHLISMVFELIGMPKEIHSEQHSKLEWHNSGSIFVGSGITDKSIPFSYHSDWKSGGRWGIEIFTEKNSYLLMPLEKLYMCPKNDTKWTEIPLYPAFPNVKSGLAEQIAIMLTDTQIKSELTSLKNAVDLIKIAEKIFGYDNP